MVGDALLNMAATLCTLSAGEAKSVRVKNSVLSEAVKAAGLGAIGRHDSHTLADLYEGAVGYAYLHGSLTVEEAASDMGSGANSDPASLRGSGYVKLLSEVLSRLGLEGD